MKTKNSASPTLRVVSVLNCFSLEQLELSAAEISQKTRIPMTTTYRILAGLTEGRLLERNTDSGKYRIGTDLYFLGSLYLSNQDVLKAAEPVVKTLNELTNESVFVGIFDRGNIVHLMKEESKHAFRFGHTIGTIVPAYAMAMGKAFLSEMTEAEIDNFYPNENLKPLTKKTLKTKTELKLELEQVRKTGIGINKEESYEGVWAIAALLRQADGKPVAALSFGVPVFRINGDTVNRLATLIRMGASFISYRLGYQDRENPVRDIEDIRSWWSKKLSVSASQENIAPSEALVYH